MATETVRISKLAPEQYGLAAAWLADPDLNQWLYSEWRERAIDERLMAIIAGNPKNCVWLISCTERPYGLCCITSISSIDRSGILWYLRGTGIERVPGAMTVAVGKVIHEGFSKLGLQSISASILEPNEASRHILEKNGFREAGRLRKAFIMSNGFVDRIIFDLIPEDLVSRRIPPTAN